MLAAGPVRNHYQVRKKRSKSSNKNQDRDPHQIIIRIGIRILPADKSDPDPLQGPHQSNAIRNTAFHDPDLSC
jgi:hypothetical protein